MWKIAEIPGRKLGGVNPRRQLMLVLKLLRKHTEGFND
jgi:hypothetical protein